MSAALGAHFQQKGAVMDDELDKKRFSQGLHLGHVEGTNLSSVGLVSEVSIDFSLSICLCQNHKKANGSFLSFSNVSPFVVQNIQVTNKSKHGKLELPSK